MNDRGGEIEAFIGVGNLMKGPAFGGGKIGDKTIQGRERSGRRDGGRAVNLT